MPSRYAVVAVVSRNRCAHLGRDGIAVAELERPLDHAQVRPRVLERDLASEPVERLERLDRVALHARPDGVADDGEQVHEALRAQQIVELLLARPVPAHQALERRWLVRRVVIDVHLRVALGARDGVVDERFECAALLGVRVRPVRVIRRRAVRVRRHPAEEVFAAVLARERIALEVEEHVFRRRLGQSRETEPVLYRQQLVHRPRLIPARELDRGLVDGALERGLGASPHVERTVLAERAEPLKRRHSALFDDATLHPRDPRDEGQVIVAAPPGVARRPPDARLALVDGLGVVSRADVLVRARDGRLELRLDPPEVRRIGVEAIGLDRVLGVRRDDVKGRGCATLRVLEQRRVERELEDRRAARLHRELRVDGLVRPVSQGARSGDLEQDVRLPDPTAAAERRLHDGVGSAGHRVEGSSGGELGEEKLAEIDDSEAAGAEGFDVRSLVLEPALNQRLEERILGAEGPVDGSSGERHVEAGLVPAPQESREVGCRENVGVVVEIHGNSEPTDPAPCLRARIRRFLEEPVRWLGRGMAGDASDGADADGDGVRGEQRRTPHHAADAEAEAGSMLGEPFEVDPPFGRCDGDGSEGPEGSRHAGVPCPPGSRDAQLHEAVAPVDAAKVLGGEAGLVIVRRRRARDEQDVTAVRSDLGGLFDVGAVVDGILAKGPRDELLSPERAVARADAFDAPFDRGRLVAECRDEERLRER